MRYTNPTGALWRW